MEITHFKNANFGVTAALANVIFIVSATVALFLCSLMNDLTISIASGLFHEGDYCCCVKIYRLFYVAPTEINIRHINSVFKQLFFRKSHNS